MVVYTVGQELSELNACGHHVRRSVTSVYNRVQWWLKQEALTSISRSSSQLVMCMYNVERVKYLVWKRYSSSTADQL